MKRRLLILLTIVGSLLLPWNMARQGGVQAGGVSRAPGSPFPATGEMLGTQGGTWRNYSTGNYVNTLAIEGDYVWAGTDGGVVRWDGTDGSYVKYSTTDGLADNRIHTITIDGAGHKWFGTWGSGVSEFDDTTWTTYTTDDGLASNDVRAIAIDEAGHLWFSTWGNGVSRFDGSTWTTYTTDDGLAACRREPISPQAGLMVKWFPA